MRRSLIQAVDEGATEVRSEPAGAPSAVVVRGVAVDFDAPDGSVFRALEDVSFSVELGQFVAVVGPSGCGKSTLLRVMAGLVELSAGEILVDGKLVTTPGRDRAVVFQHATLLPWRTVLGNVLFGLEVDRTLDSRIALQRARNLIEIVGLQGFEDHFPRQLSGGMQQRVNLARALAVNPRVLLLDEPFASLDAQTRENMQLELQRIWMENRTSMIFVTHDITEAAFLADRVVTLGGRPGTVAQMTEVNLPRPRTLEQKRDGAFSSAEDEIWESIARSQLRRADES